MQAFCSGIFADQRDFFLWPFHSSGSLRGDLQVAIRSGDRAYHRLSTFDRHVKFGLGLRVLDGVDLEPDLTGGGLKDQRLATGLDDGPA